MHSNVTIKNVSEPHFSWPTLYIRAHHHHHLRLIKSCQNATYTEYRQTDPFDSMWPFTPTLGPFSTTSGGSGPVTPHPSGVGSKVVSSSGYIRQQRGKYSVWSWQPYRLTTAAASDARQQ